MQQETPGAALAPTIRTATTEIWAPDYLVELKSRIKRMQFVQANPDKINALMTWYRTHPVEWIQHWGITYDPRKPSLTTMPFILFKRQKEFVEFLEGCLADQQGGLVEKSRDIGASWLCVSYAVWLWLFRPGASVGFGSMLVTKVDKIGDMDSLLEKVRSILRALPGWMLPLGFKMNTHATWMKIINPENGAIIKGEGGDNIGRGGRSLIYFKDESAHYERPEMIEAALGDNTNVQIDISSVNGSANVFYRRRMGGEVWTPGCQIERGKTRVFIFDWSDHPGKSQEWHDERERKAADDGLLHVFRSEVDRDYAGSIDRVIIEGHWVDACFDAHLKLAHLGDWFSGSTIGGQDLRDEGKDKHALAIRKGVVLNYCDHWGEGDPGDAAHKAIPICVEAGCFELYYDCIGVGAGFKVGINQMKKQPNWNPRMRVIPWDAGAEVLDPEKPIIPGDRESPKNKDHYGNFKAQSAFRLRTRFIKTYKCITEGAVYPVSELISLSGTLPRRHEIKMELSQPVHIYAGDGKTLIDKKPKGARSPNLFDAINECYNPARTSKGFFDVSQPLR